MAMNFPGLTGQAGGEGSKQSSNYTTGLGGEQQNCKDLEVWRFAVAARSALVDVMEW